MNNRPVMVGIVVVITVVAFLLEPNGPFGGFWEPADSVPDAEGAQVPLLMLIGAIEALALALGIVFVIWGFGRIEHVAQVTGATLGQTRLAFIAVAWFLLNWWAHDSLHINNGLDLNGLIVIEYVFHVTLIACAAYLAYYLTRSVARNVS